MKKIILTGPESSGKSTLAQQLADQLQTTWVSEYARTYLNHLERPYTQEDLYPIALGQFQKEQEAAVLQSPFLICDTSFLVLKIWSLYKYGVCHPFILKQVAESKNDLYLLCGCEVPWEADPLRENSDDRAVLYELYLTELRNLGAEFVELRGNENTRLRVATKFIFENKKNTSNLSEKK